MWGRVLRDSLFPGAAEQDAEFRHEIDRLSHFSLRVIGGAEIAVALFMLLARVLVSPDPYASSLRIIQASMIVALGLTCLFLAYSKRLYCSSRLVALANAFAVSAILIWFSIRAVLYSPSADDLIPGQITLVTLVAVTAIPAQPWHILALGGLTGVFYIATAEFERIWFQIGDGPDPITIAFNVMLTLLATALSTVLYGQRLANYRSYLQSRQTATRSLLAENAASLGRLAAAISHELNSPLGALISSVDTLLLLAARQATSDPKNHQRLVLLQGELRQSIRESADRLKTIVGRLQRFTNLDKAEVQQVDLNELVSDVVALMGPELTPKATLDVDLKPLEPLVCRPQQISAVLSSLMHNAVSSLNGDGRIAIRTQQTPEQVEVHVQDNGRGVAEKELSSIFEPTFKVTSNRVGTSNWSLFSARQIIREHGGDITITSQPGQGTHVQIHLPIGGMTEVSEIPGEDDESHP